MRWERSLFFKFVVVSHALGAPQEMKRRGFGLRGSFQDESVIRVIPIRAYFQSNIPHANTTAATKGAPTAADGS